MSKLSAHNAQQCVRLVNRVQIEIACEIGEFYVRSEKMNEKRRQSERARERGTWRKDKKEGKKRESMRFH